MLLKYWRSDILFLELPLIYIIYQVCNYVFGSFRWKDPFIWKLRYHRFLQNIAHCYWHPFPCFWLSWSTMLVEKFIVLGYIRIKPFWRCLNTSGTVGKPDHGQLNGKSKLQAVQYPGNIADGLERPIPAFLSRFNGYLSVRGALSCVESLFRVFSHILAAFPQFSVQSNKLSSLSFCSDGFLQSEQLIIYFNALVQPNTQENLRSLNILDEPKTLKLEKPVLVI